MRRLSRTPKFLLLTYPTLSLPWSPSAAVLTSAPRAAGPTQPRPPTRRRPSQSSPPRRASHTGLLAKTLLHSSPASHLPITCPPWCLSCFRPRPAAHQPPTGRHECCFILDPSRWRTPLLWSWHYRPIERSFFCVFYNLFTTNFLASRNCRK